MTSERKPVSPKKAASQAQRAPKAPTKPSAAGPEGTRAAEPGGSRPVATGGPERRRRVVGLVVSDRMRKTIVVKVDRWVRHGLYGKYVTRSRRFKAHDEKSEAKIGDLVSLVESRPLSSEKRWALSTILRRGGGAPEVAV